MTCIVGKVDGKKVFMASDSVSANAYAKREVNTPKMFVVKTPDKVKILIGGTTSWRMLQLLQLEVKYPTLGKLDIPKYLVTKLVPKIRKVFADNGFTTISSNKERGGQFLIGLKRRLFLIESDFCVLERVNGGDAIGSGFEVALGAIYALDMCTDIDPDEKCMIAVEAAKSISRGVGGTVRILGV